MYFWLLIPFILISILASSNVNRVFKKYLKVQNSRAITGFEAAQRIARSNNLDIQIEMINADEGDHYDPTTKTVRLSRPVYEGRSITSISVASHELGHALQHSKEYAFLGFRSAMFPIVNIASSSWYFLFILGMILGLASTFGSLLMQIAVLLYSGVVIFQIVTLPVEFNASSRAIVQMNSLGLITDDEQIIAKKVLRAAALTYVAAALAAVASLVRMFLISRD